MPHEPAFWRILQDMELHPNSPAVIPRHVLQGLVLERRRLKEHVQRQHEIIDRLVAALNECCPESAQSLITSSEEDGEPLPPEGWIG